MVKLVNLLATMAIASCLNMSNVHADELQSAIESMSNGEIKSAAQFLSNAAKGHFLELNIYTGNDISIELAATSKLGVVRALQLVIRDCGASSLSKARCQAVGKALKLAQSDSSESGIKSLNELSQQIPNNPAILFLAKRAEFQRAMGNVDTQISIPELEQYKTRLTESFGGKEATKLVGHYLFELAMYQASVAPLLASKNNKDPQLRSYLNAYNNLMSVDRYVHDRRITLTVWRESVVVGRKALQLMLRNTVYLIENRLANRTRFREILKSRRAQLKTLGVRTIPGESTGESAFYYFYEFLDWLKM